jgi:hypothetical protein
MARARKAARDPALEDLLLTGLAEGITLRKLCRRHQLSPATVQRWRMEDRDFARRFALAREAGFEAIAEETLEIADDDTGDTIGKEKVDGTVAIAKNPDNVARARLRVETRLKLLSKWAPGKYGESAGAGEGQDWSERLAAARARVLKGR